MARELPGGLLGDDEGPGMVNQQHGPGVLVLVRFFFWERVGRVGSRDKAAVMTGPNAHLHALLRDHHRLEPPVLVLLVGVSQGKRLSSV